jgi:hypothetical protein
MIDGKPSVLIAVQQFDWPRFEPHRRPVPRKQRVTKI